MSNREARAQRRAERWLENEGYGMTDEKEVRAKLTAEVKSGFGPIVSFFFSALISKIVQMLMARWLAKSTARRQ